MSVFNKAARIGDTRPAAASGDIVVLTDSKSYKVMSYRRVMGAFLYSVRCMQTRVITNDIPEMSIVTSNGLPIN